jgi:hypothetical protein
MVKNIAGAHEHLNAVDVHGGDTFGNVHLEREELLAFLAKSTNAILHADKRFILNGAKSPAHTHAIDARSWQGFENDLKTTFPCDGFRMEY